MDSIPLSIIALNPISLGMMTMLAVVLLLILLSAFVCAASNAFSTLMADDSDSDTEDNYDDDIVSPLFDNPKYLISTIRILEVFADSALIILFVVLLDSIFNIHSFLLRLVVFATIITLVIVIFCKLIPTYIALHNPQKTATTTAGLVRISQKIFFPLKKLFAGPLSLADQKLSTHKHQANISIDDLSQALELTSENITEDTDILKGIVTLGNTDVASIMTQRPDITAIELKTSFDKVISEIARSEYSRIPVYNNTIDNIRGILYAKDLIPHIDKGSNFKWQALVRPPYYVPETKKTDDLLQEFQANKIHIAVVVDEFGGTSGIVTMEDVLEEVVGEISDEHDDDDRLYTIDSDGAYLFEGKIPLSDFFKTTDINPDDFSDYIEDVDTLAGLILELNGNFPESGDRIIHKQYTFEIKEIEGQRILKIKLTIGKNSPEPSDD